MFFFLRISSVTGNESSSISLGDVVDVTIDFGSDLNQDFTLEIDDCSLVSGSRSFPLISDGLIDQESDIKSEFGNKYSQIR